MLNKLTLPTSLIESTHTLEEFLECEQRGATSILQHIFSTDLSHIPEGILKLAGERGTSVHESIETWLQGGELDFFFEYKEWGKGFDKFLESIETIQPLGVELRCVTEHVKGVIDFVGYIDGELTMIDWKTSSNMSGETRLSAELQLQLYTYMLSECYGIDVDKVAVVSVQKNKFRRIDVEYDKDVALGLISTYVYKCKFVKHKRKED